MFVKTSGCRRRYLDSEAPERRDLEHVVVNRDPLSGYSIVRSLDDLSTDQ
jgi:hypothetical protein